MPRPPLSVSDNMRFQERAWLARRIGWGLLAGAIAFALAGGFGNGAVSAARQQADTVGVDYERFQRRGAKTHFVLHIPKRAEDEVWLRFGPAFQDIYEIEAVQPPPTRSHIGRDGLSLYFDSYEAGDLRVVVRARPRRFGVVTPEIVRPPATLQIPALIFP
jgi:hypothetical protein